MKKNVALVLCVGGACILGCSAKTIEEHCTLKEHKFPISIRIEVENNIDMRPAKFQYAYELSPKTYGAVGFLLEQKGERIEAGEFEYQGGIDGLKQDLVRGFAESVEAGPRIPISTVDTRRKISFVIHTDELTQSIIIEGTPSAVTAFLRTKPSLKRVLLALSSNRPKAFRILDESGPNKATLPPASQ